MSELKGTGEVQARWPGRSVNEATRSRGGGTGTAVITSRFRVSHGSPSARAATASAAAQVSHAKDLRAGRRRRVTARHRSRWDDRDVPQLSVVTPTYEYGRFLEQLLDSVARLRTEHEHIVLDGGSTDQTVALLEAREDPALHWTSQADRGQNDAVNRGLRRVRGDYVAWVNSDNVLVAGAFDAAVALLERREDVHAVFGGIDIIDEKGVVRRRYVPPPFHWRRWLYLGDYVPTETIVFRRALLATAPQLDEACGDAADYDFYLRLLHLRRVERLAGPMLLYRHHAAAKTTSNPWRGQRATRAVRERWAVRPRQIALMRGIDLAKRSVLPLISPWPEPY